MNLVTGDYIEFELPQFEGGSYSQWGRHRSGSGARYVGDKSFEGVIKREWYDSNRRHWFSIRLTNGTLKRAQGKNLYPGVTVHSPGENHNTTANEKQLRKEVV